MNRATVTFLWRLVVFSLLLARPVSIRAADPMIVGVAGPAINMVYSFVARDAGLFRDTVSMRVSSSLTPAPSWHRPRSRESQSFRIVGSSHDCVAHQGQTQILCRLRQYPPLQPGRCQRNNQMGPAQRQDNRYQPLRFGNGHRDPLSAQEIWTRSRQRCRHRSTRHPAKSRAGFGRRCH